MPAQGGKGGGGNAIKAGEAYFEINADDSMFTSTLKGAVNKIHKFGRTISSVGFGIAGAGAGILAPLTAVFTSALNRADEMQDIADRLQVTTEGMSALGYAAEMSAMEMEDMVAATNMLQKATVAAANGSKQQVEAFAAMNTTAEEFAKLPIEERYLALADAVAGMDEPLERSNFLMKLFGKQASTVIPLLAGGSENLKKLFEEANLVGAVVNGEEAQRFATFKDQFDKAWKAVKNTILEVGVSLLGLTDTGGVWLDTLTNTLAQIREFIKSNKTIILTVAGVAAGLVAGGVALAAFGYVITGVIAGVTALVSIGSTLLAVVFSPLVIKIALITAAVAALTYAFYTFTDVGRELGDSLMTTFASIGSTFKLMFGGIVDALKKGEFQTAGKILMMGLAVAFQEGIVILTDAWNKFKSFFVDGWHDAMMLIELGWNATAGWIVETFYKAIGKVLAKISEVAEVFGLKFDTSDLQKGADLLAREARAETERRHDAIIRTAEEEQRFRDESRANDLQAERETLQLFRDALGILVESVKDNEEAAQPNNPSAPMARLETAIREFGDSVRGTFGSADYRGSMALGQANSEAKKQTDLQRQMLEQLEEINASGGAVFG